MNQSLKEATPVVLKELINYQTGSVVSREIMRTSKGSVTLFAFDKDQGLSEHQTPFEALVTVLDGRAQITVSGQASTVVAGESLLMPAGSLHSLKAVESFKMLLTMLA